MLRNKPFFIIVLVFFTSVVFAQKKVLHGKITNENDVEGIHVLNTTSRFNAVTNENGNFSINVNINDTLVFSSVHFFPKKVAIDTLVYEKGTVAVTLTELINELDEVVLGHNLSGNIGTDLQNIKTEKPLNFDDVGIPGFKGEPQEKIVPIAMAFFPTNINIEAAYKYISGYYKTLKTQRKWEAQNQSAAAIMDFYTPKFFNEAYSIPEDRLYDFMLFCVETSSLQNDFRRENYTRVLEIFKAKSEVYVERLSSEEK